MTHTALDPAEYAALERLLKLALNDTAAARCASDFLLAWYNAAKYGGFDPAELWSLKAAQIEDVLTVMTYIARARHGPEALGLNEEMRKLVSIWRSPSELTEATSQPQRSKSSLDRQD